MIKKYILIFSLLMCTLHAKDLKQISLQLHWKYQFEFAGFIAAKEKCFYSDVGLDVELKEFQHGQNIIKEILYNKSTYGIYNSNILVDYIGKKQLKLISSFYKKAALILITKPELKYPKDLLGKKIMATGKEDFHLNFQNILAMQNIDLNSLNLIPHSFDITEFADGRVDAMTAFISDQPYKLDRLGILYNIIDPSNFGTFNLQMELFTSQAIAAKYPEQTALFRDASIKGWEYALNNPDEIINIILSKYNTQNLTRDFLEHEAMITERIVLPKMYDVGNIDEKFLLKQIEKYHPNTLSHEENEKLIDNFIFKSKEELQQQNRLKYQGLTLNLIPVFILIIILISYRQWLLKRYNKKLEKEVNEKTNEYKKQNQQLINANNNFIDLFNTAIEAIGIFDENNNLVELNLSGKKMYRCHDDNILYSQNIFDFVPPYQLEKVQMNLNKDRSEPYELDLFRYDKTIFPCIASGKDIIKDGKTFRIITVVDLSSIKQRDQLIQKQSKLAQMGEMISMIAHQWTQPLSSISATSDAIRLKSELDILDKKTTIELVDKIKNYTNHLSNTIDDFRNFYKKDKHKQETTMNLLVEKALDIIKASIEQKNIKIDIDLNASSIFETYSNEVMQVILSLLQNAQDIILENNTQKGLITVLTYEKDDEIVLSILDNGGGIEETIFDKIFEPYFSTKQNKNGTGLGLYMAKTIIEDNCGGKLHVINEPPKVTFQIVFCM